MRWMSLFRRNNIFEFHMKENKPLAPPKIVEDLANFVIRAFYQEQHVVIFQYLISLREPITDYEIANKLNLPFLYTIKALTQLSNDFLVHTFRETVEGNKDQWKYCIHYDTFLNVVKLRLEFLKEWVHEQAKQKIMGYYCKKCNEGYDQYEQMKIVMTNPQHLAICKHVDCDGEIVEDIEEFKERTGSEIPLTQVMEKDLGHVFKLLEQADKLVVPKSSRSNFRSIVTKMEAQRRNLIDRKRHLMDQGAGGSSRRRIQQSLAFLESGDQIQVIRDGDNDERGEIQMKDNTPFFLRPESTMMKSENKNMEGNQLISVNDEFNQNFLELLSSGKDFQDMEDEDEDEEEGEDEEEVNIAEDEENREMGEGRNSVVYVRGVSMSLEDIGTQEEMMMTEQEYEEYSKLLNRDIDVEW